VALAVGLFALSAACGGTQQPKPALAPDIEATVTATRRRPHPFSMNHCKYPLASACDHSWSGCCPNETSSKR